MDGGGDRGELPPDMCDCDGVEKADGDLEEDVTPVLSHALWPDPIEFDFSRYCGGCQSAISQRFQ